MSTTRALSTPRDREVLSDCFVASAPRDDGAKGRRPAHTPPIAVFHAGVDPTA